MAWLKKLFGEKAPHAVTLRPGGRSFEIPRGETVLERALKAGIAYPHDCTVGTCGACRTRLVEGQVEAITPFGYTLSREELEAGYILACQALPKSDLVLEVDTRGPAIAARAIGARLVGLDDLTHDIRRATFALDAPLDYVAGQYANIAWPGDARARSYSFSQPPLPGGRAQISTFVRPAPGGKFTEHLFGPAAFETPYVVEGPHGDFWLHDGDGPILCVAGGSGLAPILSLLQAAAERGVARDCILLFGARAARDLYAAVEIAAVANRWPARFDYWPVLSETATEGYREGFVTAHIAPALQSLGAGAQAYLCGPPAMIDAGIDAITRCGVNLADIHYDRFTDASNAAGAGLALAAQASS
jgi:p-cymene monooxygenase electron transfer component